MRKSDKREKQIRSEISKLSKDFDKYSELAWMLFEAGHSGILAAEEEQDEICKILQNTAKALWDHLECLQYQTRFLLSQIDYKI